MSLPHPLIPREVPQRPLLFSQSPCNLERLCNQECVTFMSDTSRPYIQYGESFLCLIVTHAQPVTCTPQLLQIEHGAVGFVLFPSGRNKTASSWHPLNPSLFPRSPPHSSVHKPALRSTRFAIRAPHFSIDFPSVTDWD